jgi:hypothetical protein
VAERWQQLPLGPASSRMRRVRSVVQGLADAVADLEGRTHTDVPDLGPAVVMDQLAVVVHDALEAGVDPAADLADLRRSLS